jgi:uncharacterized protein (UPF0212 family)
MGETLKDISNRLNMSADWVQVHMGEHRCLDGRRYIDSCLVTDPACHHLARRRLGDLLDEGPSPDSHTLY